MLSESSYQAARSVAATVERHFAHHHASALLSGERDLAPLPHQRAIETIIDVAFWASLRREEGYSPKISLAFLPLKTAHQPLSFAYRLPLTPAILTKLAPAVERPGIHLGVWHEDDQYYIWGTTQDIPTNCFVLEVIEPGLLVIKHRRMGGFGKFVNVAILKGDQIKVVDDRTGEKPDCPELLNSMLGFTSPAYWNNSLNVMVQLAVSMRAHGRGGLLLVVPAGSRTWPESIIQPMTYAVEPAFSLLADLLRRKPAEKAGSEWRGALSMAVEGVAGLTAVDGATLINHQYELLGFGAKIGRSLRSTPVEQIVVTEPIVGNVPLVIHPTQAGGTRHLSAAQFVFDQRDATALVASQDGRFTIFAWSDAEGMVHAHRVDSLLL